MSQHNTALVPVTVDEAGSGGTKKTAIDVAKLEEVATDYSKTSSAEGCPSTAEEESCRPRRPDDDLGRGLSDGGRGRGHGGGHRGHVYSNVATKKGA